MIIYITSIASNEKFKKNPFILITFLFMFIRTNFLFNKSLDTNPINELKKEIFLTKFFNFPFINLTTIIIIYLLITLIVIVKITRTKRGPLRQKY